MSDRGDCVLQCTSFAHMHVDIACCNQRYSSKGTQMCEFVQSLFVAGTAMQFHGYPTSIIEMILQPQCLRGQNLRRRNPKSEAFGQAVFELRTRQMIFAL